MEKTNVSRRALKKHVIEELKKQDWTKVQTLLELFPPAKLINPLFSGLCHPDENVRWNAVLLFGLVMAQLAENDPEQARVVMRRFLWSMNDESGGIGWGVCESMAEIFCHSDLLRREYLHMLLSYMRDDGPEPFQDGNFLELPMLQRGLLWGIGRVCAEFPELMLGQGVVDDLFAYLEMNDPGVVGMAVRCLIILPGVRCEARCRVLLEPYQGSSCSLRFLEGHTICSVTLGELIEKFCGQH